MEARWSFGGLDLNQPADEDVVMQEQVPEGAGQFESTDVPLIPPSGASGSVDSATKPAASHPNSASIPSTGTTAGTGQTQSSEESASDDEVQSTPSSQTEIKTPYVGMIFESLEETKLQYNKYAKHVGFSIKTSTSRNSTVDKQKDKCLFVCNKIGKNDDINQQEEPPVKQRNRSITKRTECRARLRVKRIGVKWHVTMFVEEHTHELIKKFSLKRYLRSHRGIPKEEKDFVKILHKVNLSAGRVMHIMSELYGKLANVPYVKKDVSNYMSTLDAVENNCDMDKLLAKFEEVKKEDPAFFYKLKVDSHGRVENIFWVDGPAISAYKLYHDCLSFDTTYMTNMYNMPCSPFIGINRYGQSIQLGCGFLRNEKIPNFVWLFEAFLEAMGGVQPDNIITDQDGAMRSAILIVFPDSIHRNCRWHIMQKLQEKVGPFMSKREDLRIEFNNTIDFSMTVEEFETRWAEMMVKHNVGDNKHLLDLYDLRACFVPAYFKERFFPFLQTTARSEGFNAVLKRYINPHNSLTHFFEQYLKIQEKIDVAEDSNEFEVEDKVLRPWSEYPMEAQAMKIYTRPIYLRFRAELRKVTAYNATNVGGSLFEILPIKGSVYGYGTRGYRVECNVEEATYTCECSKVCRDGILCCHAMRVMIHMGATDFIPDQYLLPRWMNPEEVIVPVKIHVPEMPKDGKLTNKEKKLLRYGNLCNDWTAIAMAASGSDKAKALAEKHMRALEVELKELKISEAAKRKSKKKTDANTAVHGESSEVPSAADAGDSGLGSTPQTTHVRDPPHTTTKGRPGEKRKKSGLGLKSTKPNKCSVCGSTEHRSSDCAAKITPDPEPTEFNFFRDMV